MSQVKLGDKNIPFIYQGNELLYPNPVKNGLILWYDFKGMKNSDVGKGIVTDLSGKGNNGTLQNFAYTSESGYNDGLKFDSVDDFVSLGVPMGKSFTLSMTIEFDPDKTVQFFCAGKLGAFYIRRNYNDLHASILVEPGVQSTTSSGNKFFYNLISNNKKRCQVALSVDDNSKKMFLFGNGELLTSVDISDSSKENDLTKLGVWQGNTNLDGKIFSCQLYNKSLPEEKIQHNYKLEKERWGL